MGRPKKYKNPKSISIITSEERYKRMERKRIEMSYKEGRNISLNEMLNDLFDQKFPNGNQDDEDDQFEFKFRR